MREVRVSLLICIYFVWFTAYGPQNLGQVKELLRASVSFSVSRGYCCEDSEKMEFSDNNRNSPHRPIVHLGWGSVLTQEDLRVLTHRSAIFIKMCAGFITSGLHYKADLRTSVKLIPGEV